jgi:hypothetical protein
MLAHAMLQQSRSLTHSGLSQGSTSEFGMACR